MTTPSPATTLERRPGVLAQQVKPTDPSIVLLDSQSGEYYTLEAVGTRVWQLCDGARTLGEIAAVIAKEYDQSPEVIERDILELAQDLMAEQLVVLAP
jgi:coenzyme PQQ synthesis protein D (PqqD)